MPAKTFEDILKFNPNHDNRGRFSTAGGGGAGIKTDSALFARAQFKEIAGAAEKIADAARTELGISAFGLRVQEHDTETVGAPMTHRSQNFGGDFEDAHGAEYREELDGVSTIGLGRVGETGEFGGYSGTVAYLIGGEQSDPGYDPGEDIIKEPVVLAKFGYKDGKLIVLDAIKHDQKATESEKPNSGPDAPKPNKEYTNFVAQMAQKYGADEMYSKMTDSEFDKYQHLEMHRFDKSAGAKTFEDILKTTAAPTGCGVLVLRDGKVLTGTRTERASRGQICGPGGHIEPGETPEEAAKREAMEEFGIECHGLQRLGTQPGGRYGTAAVFLCTDYTGKPRTDEEEMTNPKWLTIRQIRALDAFPPFLRSLELLPRDTVRKFNPYDGPDGRSSSTQGGETMQTLEERRKSEGIQWAPKEEETRKAFRIYKANEDQRLVFGWASVAITVDGAVLEDRQHDTIDPEDLEEAAYEYVLNFRDTGEEHLPGYRKKGRLVESCVFTPEKQRAMGLPEGALPVAWWIGFKIDDEDTWQRIKDGTYKMFSIEGRAQREPIEKADSTARTFDEVLKFNPYHDGAGRFASASGATSMTVFTNSPQGQKAIANIRARELAAMGGGGGSSSNTKPKDVATDKPQTKKFKKIDDDQAKAMAKEMGQSPEQISDQDMKALQGYINTANSFNINEELRNGTPVSEMSKKDQKTIATMDKHMQPSTEDIQVQRMCGRALLESLGLGKIKMSEVTNEKLKSLEGKEYSQNGYTSTSFDIGENVFTGRPIKMNINVPKGAKMLISPTREWDDKVIEAEIILARNTPMRITKARVTQNGWGENVVELDIDVLLD